MLQYGPTRGHKPLIEAIVELLGDARHQGGRRRTCSSPPAPSRGWTSLAGCCSIPGDVVLVELPAYTGAISAFKNTEAALVGVQQEPDGIDLADLELVVARERAAGRRVRFLYLVPNFQNPTGLLISLEKRRRLLEWASRRDLLIVEDDPYGALYFEDAASAADTRPIKADDERGARGLPEQLLEDARARVPRGVDGRRRSR